MACWKTIEEIVKYCPTVLRVTDDGYRDLNGPVADGNWDWHVAGCAVDFAGSDSDMRDQAEWWYQFSDYLLELIHTTPYDTDSGFYVKNGSKVGEGYYGPSVNAAHQNHVHVAMSDTESARLLRYLKSKYGPPGRPIPAPAPTPETPLSEAQKAWNSAYNLGWDAAFNPAFNSGFNSGYSA